MTNQQLTRQNFTANSLEHYFAVLERGNLREQMIDLHGSLGYQTATEDLFSAETYQVVAPAESGELDLTGMPERAIAVVALKLGEKLAALMQPHELQVPALVSHGYDPQAVAAVPIENYSDDVLASVWGSTILTRDAPGSAAKIYHRGRPIIMLNMTEQAAARGRGCPTVVGHEVVHVAQMICRPVFELDAADARGLAGHILQDELEAYSLQALMHAETMLDLEYESTIDMALTVNGLRRRILQDSYKLTDSFIASARADRIVSRVLPPALLR